MMVPLDNGTHFIDQTSHRMKLFTSPPVEAVRDLTDRRATQSWIVHPSILLWTEVAFRDAL